MVCTPHYIYKVCLSAGCCTGDTNSYMRVCVCVCVRGNFGRADFAAVFDHEDGI